MAIHPVSVSNTFARHTVFWLLFLPLMSIIFLPLLIKDQNIHSEEMSLIADMGVDLQSVSDRTNRIYTSLFIETGILPATESLFGTDEYIASKHTHDGVIENTKFAGGWIRGVWQMLYKAIWRVNILISIFLLPVLFLCIPAAIDGFSTRAKKQYRFENSNPVFFYTSTHTALLIIGLFLYLPLIPFALSSYLLAGFLFALGVSIWIATSNFQTGM